VARERRLRHHFWSGHARTVPRGRARWTRDGSCS
jgi:hypothetical protein